jgi:hypothetical protein
MATELNSYCNYQENWSQEHQVDMFFHKDLPKSIRLGLSGCKHSAFQ